MGRSVSYPAGAVVAYVPFGGDEDTDWEWEYDCLVEDIRQNVRDAFPSFDPVDCWRDREDRVLMRNTFADIGLSTYGGIAAIWLVERADSMYAYRRQWGSHSSLARGWITQAAAKFDKMFGQLDCVGRFSNGETLYETRKAA